MDSRMVCIDGAVEWFAPHSGQRLRVDGPELARVRLQAPRSVQFALTNHCNLACSFCSRPQERRSTWTVASALMAHCRTHGLTARMALSEAHRDAPDLDALWDAREYEGPDDAE